MKNIITHIQENLIEELKLEGTDTGFFESCKAMNPQFAGVLDCNDLTFHKEESPVKKASRLSEGYYRRNTLSKNHERLPVYADIEMVKEDLHNR